MWKKFNDSILAQITASQTIQIFLVVFLLLFFIIVSKKKIISLKSVNLKKPIETHNVDCLNKNNQKNLVEALKGNHTNIDFAQDFKSSEILNKIKNKKYHQVNKQTEEKYYKLEQKKQNGKEATNLLEEIKETVQVDTRIMMRFFEQYKEIIKNAVILTDFELCYTSVAKFFNFNIANINLVISLNLIRNIENLNYQPKIINIDNLKEIELRWNKFIMYYIIDIRKMVHNMDEYKEKSKFIAILEEKWQKKINNISDINELENQIFHYLHMNKQIIMDFLEKIQLVNEKILEQLKLLQTILQKNYQLDSNIKNIVNKNKHLFSNFDISFNKYTVRTYFNYIFRNLFEDIILIVKETKVFQE